MKILKKRSKPLKKNMVVGKERRCDLCLKAFSQDILRDQNDLYRHLFYTLCIECINTCYQCGQDSGFPRHKSTLVGDCHICEKPSCRSCGVNITCSCGCEQTACQDCIQEDQTCVQLKEKLTRFDQWLQKASL